MKEFWRRWRRLWGESRIRLKTLDLQVDGIQAGDRLQIGPRLWHVERCPGLALGTVQQAVLELVDITAAEKQLARRARLCFDRSNPELPWILQENDGAVRLAARDLTHFPVADSCS